MLALYPIFFAVIQFSEGVVWLTLRSPSAPGRLNLIATFIFVVFSHALWPTVVPASVYSVEKNEERRKWIRGILIIGILLSLGTLVLMLKYGVYSQIVSSAFREHIDYMFVVSYGYIFRYVYLAVISLPFFIASSKRLRFFGALWVLSFAGAFFIFRVAYISVWCFFAGVLSLLIYLHFKYPQRSLAGSGKTS